MLRPACARHFRSIAAALVASAAAGCAPEAETLPPYGEAVLSIDTDAPVPDVAGRLRVDVYAEEGRWLDSLDVPARRLDDWPGSFSVFTEDEDERVALVRLRAYSDGRVRDYRGERFAAPPPGAPLDFIVYPPVGDGQPRLVREGQDLTPGTEPLPNLAIDRLLRVRLRYGHRGSLRVVLRTACAGTMVDLAASATCVDTAGVRVPVDEEDASGEIPPPSESEAGTFVGPTDCTVLPRPESQLADGAPKLDEETCIPGGSFVLGSQAIVVSGPVDVVTESDSSRFNSIPEHVAVMPPLLMDRYEVTVGRYRHALEVDGFQRPDGSPLANNGPLGTVFPGGQENCTYSSAPLGREGYPLNCISWFNARAFCQFYGGELPTEAEWEHAAAAAARDGETAYPWGSQAPTCDRAVYARSNVEATPVGSAECVALGFGPQPLVPFDPQQPSAGDVGPSLVIGLGGSLSEWVLDSARSYASACWLVAPPLSPLCWEEAPVRRSVRGGNWAQPPGLLLAAARDESRTDLVTSLVGFRCVRRGR